MKNGFRTIVAVTVIGTACSSVHATDVGMPLYSSAIGKKGNAEVYYEQYKRDVKQDGDLGPSTGEQEESRIIARLNYHASPSASLYAEVGLTDSDQSEGNVPLFGAGLKIKVYDKEVLQVNAFASITYVPEIEYKSDGYVDYTQYGYEWVDTPDFIQKESYMEINGGLAISKFIQLDESTTLTPYGGFMLSKLDGDEDFEFKYHVQERTEKANGEIEDDGIFSLFAGLGLTLDDTWGIRFEGRFINQSSFSAGLMYFF